MAKLPLQVQPRFKSFFNRIINQVVVSILSSCSLEEFAKLLPQLKFVKYLIKQAQPINCYTIRVWPMIPIRSCQLLNKWECEMGNMLQLALAPGPSFLFLCKRTVQERFLSFYNKSSLIFRKEHRRWRLPHARISYSCMKYPFIVTIF